MIGEGATSAVEAVALAEIERDEYGLTEFGLSLAEGRALLAAAQAAPVKHRASSWLRAETSCPSCHAPLRHNDSACIAMRTVFGKVSVASPRLRSCTRLQDAGSRRPVGRIATSLGEGAVPPTDGANIEYAAGPAYVGIGTRRTDGGNRAAIIAAAYDFGFVRPADWYAVSRHGNGIAKFVYRHFDPDTGSGNLNASTGLGGAASSKIGVGYEHFLSRRTSVLGVAAVGRQHLSGLASTSASDVGIRHVF